MFVELSDYQIAYRCVHSSWKLFSTIDGCHAKTLHVCSLDDSNDGEFFLSETEFFAKKEEESQCSVKKAHNTNELLFFLFQKQVLINFDCSNMRFVVKMKSKKKRNQTQPTTQFWVI